MQNAWVLNQEILINPELYQLFYYKKIQKKTTSKLELLWQNFLDPHMIMF